MRTAVKQFQTFAEAAAAWRDPEFLGPPGLGCSHCHAEEPLIETSFGALGERCLAAWFPNKPFEWVMEWLGRQHERLVRDRKRKEALEAARKGDYNLAVEYDHKYGVWLLEWRAKP